MKTIVPPPANNSSSEAGYTLIAVIVVAAFCLVLTGSLLQYAAGSSSYRVVVNANTKNYYEVERTINKVTAWMQSNSKNLVNAFSAANFPNNFDTGAPSVGSNEGSSFQVATLVKMKGTNNAVQLTNNAFFGTSAFPTTTNIDTAASYDPVSSFQSADFGNVTLRILLVWARSTDNNYEPIFRIDAITGSNPQRGVHGINFVRSDLVVSTVGFGYFADTGDFHSQTPNNTCNSYVWTWNSGTSTWSRGASRTNCIFLGTDSMNFTGKIWGNVYTNLTNGITGTSNISGTKCQAPGCHGYSLPTQTPWTTNCGASNQGDITADNPTLLSAGASMATRCWRDVTINSNKVLKLNTAGTYYFRTLDFRNNSNSQMQFATVAPGQKYTIYVDSFAAGSLNGNQWIATNLAPHQVEVNITSNASFKLNGTATIHGVFNCNNASDIDIRGTFSFFGAARCNTITTGGNAVINYDEGLGTGGVLSDMQFSLYKASQRYR